MYKCTKIQISLYPKIYVPKYTNILIYKYIICDFFVSLQEKKKSCNSLS